jgi:hypothetical protein
MKHLTWISKLLLATTLAATDSAVATPLEPRTDINPAVLYWQAFSLYPELDEELKKEFLATPPRLPLADAEPVIKKLDRMFKYLRRAAQMKVPCDWGIDLSEGPEALIPNLVKIRQAGQAAVARAHYLLEAGRDLQAVDDLAAIVVLGRNSGTDGTLVSAMIGIALEGLVNEFVARNFYRFSPPALLSFVKQVDAAPPRPTVKKAMSIEQVASLDWYIGKLEGIRAAHPQDESQALGKARELLVATFEFDSAKLDRIVANAGNTMAGLINSFQQLKPIYELIQKAADAPPEKLEETAASLRDVIDNHPNEIARLIVPNIEKARKTEMAAIARGAMIRAAIALRLEGDTGFQKIRDPFGDGPFTLRRLPAESGEQGFELDSRVSAIRPKTALKFFEDKPEKPAFE